MSIRITDLTLILEDGTNIKFRYNTVNDILTAYTENMLKVPKEQWEKAEKLAMSIFKSKY